MRILVGLAKENTSRCPVKVVTTCHRENEYTLYRSFTEVQTGFCRGLLKGTLRVFHTDFILYFIHCYFSFVSVKQLKFSDFNF